MTELKPCPFCGRNVEFEEREFDDFAGNSFTNTMSIIECRTCGIAMKRYPKRGYGTTEEQKNDLINSWNRRAGGQEAKNVDAFVQWCIDNQIVGDATIRGIKYWAEKFKEGR